MSLNTSTSTTTINFYPIESRVLTPPSLAELALVLQTALSMNYAQTDVSVVDCPDLTQSPFWLAKRGLSGGQQALIDSGSPTYFIPKPDYERIYDFVKLANQLGLREHEIFGSTSNIKFGQFLDMYASVFIPASGNDTIVNENRLLFVMRENANDKNTPPIFNVTKSVSVLNNEDATKFTFEGSFYASHGDAGKVLRIHVKNRTGSEPDFAHGIERALNKQYSHLDAPVALGGVLSVVSGSVRMLYSLDDSKGSHLFTAASPISYVSTIISKDVADLELRLHHAHGFGPASSGNYIDDDVVGNPANAENVEYIAYYNTAKVLYKVDKQPNRKQIQNLISGFKLICKFDSKNCPTYLYENLKKQKPDVPLDNHPADVKKKVSSKRKVKQNS